MSNFDIDPILESLIKLTSLRDQHSLEMSLAQVLFELVAPGAACLYRVQQDGDESPQFITTENTSGAWEISPSLREAMQETLRLAERTVVATDASTTLVYPLLDAKKEVVALIVIASTVDRAHLHHSASLVLKIYQNFLTLINDNQSDTLTGLLNRKTFEARMGSILADVRFYGQREGEDSSGGSFLAIFDIDHFKRINDNFGHLVGDEVLLLFASIMSKLFRADDLLFRFGGEEFVCVIRNVNLSIVEKALNRFRESVQNHNFPQVGQVTVSIGFTQIRPNDLSPSVIDRADEALYYAKNNGRNQVCCHEALVVNGKLASKDISGDIELF
jgi:diguanylate cyclase (GGDEF)-like protein